jgi:hypothetical protein
VGRTAQLVGEGADRLREAEALLAVSTTVNSTLDVPEALRLICRELARLLGADTAAAYRHDGTSDQLVPVAGYHVPKELVQTLLGAPLPLREQGSHDLFWRFPQQSGLVLPLVLDEQVAGAFYLVWWTARRQLTEREREPRPRPRSIDHGAARRASRVRVGRGQGLDLRRHPAHRSLAHHGLVEA